MSYGEDDWLESAYEDRFEIDREDDLYDDYEEEDEEDAA